jgi:hypothetical protein
VKKPRHKLTIKNQAQARTQRKKSSPGTIPHDIPNRPNSREQINNLKSDFTNQAQALA